MTEETPQEIAIQQVIHHVLPGAKITPIPQLNTSISTYFEADLAGIFRFTIVLDRTESADSRGKRGLTIELRYSVLDWEGDPIDTYKGAFPKLNETEIQTWLHSVRSYMENVAVKILTLGKTDPS